ncbi:hypothetical protein [Streptomyces sp. NPDC020983]|uniref:hypothetical protein n=1 Tax=Streptomyces sp. NPDC020983 TaxID=3365106 RepID=UPI0037BD07A7
MARRSRTTATALLALVVTAATGCGGGGGWKAPVKGQVAVLVEAGEDDPGERAAWLGFGGSVDGLAFGPDGTVYALGAGLVGIDGRRTVRMLLGPQAGGAGGLVVRRDGSFVTGSGGTVVSLKPNGKATVLAGAAGPERDPGAPVPGSAAATGFHFGNTGATPFGERHDGSVLLADGDVVWSLKDARLTRVYQAPDTPSKGRRPAIFVGDSTVDGTGTAWVAAVSPADEGTVGDIVTIAPGGTAVRPSLPARAAGVTESLASLSLLWMAGDGANGVYAHATSKGNDYVLHLRPGSAQLVARHRSSSADSLTCDMPHPVDAANAPCPLPYALAYHAGQLVLGGETHYVLTIALS